MKAHYFGAQFNLNAVVTTHLFIICPNNSGSTWLKHALATSRQTWNLPREGQHTVGFVGPSSGRLGVNRHWASTPENIAAFRDASSYDWPASQRAWYFQAYSQNPAAHVFVEKSPPFLLVVDQLAVHFRDARFLFMVRNPYAVVEGVLRNSRQDWLAAMGPDRALGLAAAHAVNCLIWQRRNVERWGGQSVFFTYESLCTGPSRAARAIAALVPGLDDLDLGQRLQVRQYDEPLRNMNAEHVTRLGPERCRQLTDLLIAHEDLLGFFGYRLL